MRKVSDDKARVFQIPARVAWVGMGDIQLTAHKPARVRIRNERRDAGTAGLSMTDFARALKHSVGVQQRGNVLHRSIERAKEGGSMSGVTAALSPRERYILELAASAGVHHRPAEHVPTGRDSGRSRVGWGWRPGPRSPERASRPCVRGASWCNAAAVTETTRDFERPGVGAKIL